jgi:hypothetical protein
MEPSEYHWFTHPTAVHLVPAVYTVLLCAEGCVCEEESEREVLRPVKSVCLYSALLPESP